MSMEYGYFDSEITGYDAEGMPIFDRALTSEVFAKFLSYLFSDGILNYVENCFKVAAYDGMKVKVMAGFALAQGFFGYDVSETEVTLDTAPTSYSRKDRIVVRLNKADRLVEIITKTGTVANTPVAPDIVQPASGDYFELGLAVVDISSNQVTITQANITDTRYDDSVCGISEPLIGSIDTSAIFAQLEQMLVEYQGDFEAWMAGEQTEIITWFNEIKDQISEDAAVNLQMQINTINDENICNPGTTEFNADGSITTTYDNGNVETTVFNADGSISVTTLTTTYKHVATTVFNADGSITESVTKTAI